MDKNKQDDSSRFSYKSLLRETLINETRFACTQAWFSRAIWEKRLHFLLALIKLQKGPHFIRFFSEVFPSMSKDAIYAKDSKTSTFDICSHCPIDRGLDSATLQYMMRQDLARYAKMDPEDQLEYLTGMLRIGGIALARRALHELETKLSDSEEASKMLNQELDNIFTTDSSHGEKKLKDKNKTAKGEAEVKNNKNEEIIEPENKANDEIVNENADVEETTNIEIVNSPEVKAAKEAWMEEMSHIQKDLDAWKPLTKSKEIRKPPVNVEVDTLQSLPFWATRYFARMLPSDALREIKRANTFWSTTADAMQLEQNAQNYFDKQILKNETIIQNRFSQMSQTKLSSRSTSIYSQMMKTYQKMPQEGTEEEEIKVKPRTQTIKKLLGAIKSQHVHTYNDQYCTTDVCYDYLSSRVVACCSKANLLAMTAPKPAISFFSLLTGAPLPPYLLGHTGIITSLSFHPNGDKIFSGSSDLTIRCWNIWSGTTAKIYSGHEQPITCLKTNQKYIVSGSVDGVIKVFNILSCQNTATYTEVSAISCIYIENDLQSIISGNNDGEIKVYRNPHTKQSSVTIKGHNGSILTMYITSSIILTGGSDCYAKIWNKRKPKECLLAMHHNSSVRSIILSFHQVLCGCDSGHIKIWCIFKGTLLQTFTVTPDLSPIMHLLITSTEDNPSNVVIATDSYVKIIEFYKNQDYPSHSHHTICFKDPTRTKSHSIPACQWITPKAITDILRNQEKISQGGITLRESYYHKRLQTMLQNYCSNKKLRNKQPPNTQESIFIDALQTIPQYSQLQYSLTSFPRNASNSHMKSHTTKHRRKNI